MRQIPKFVYPIIILLCLSPFVFLFYQAWYSPKIEFLAPSLRADWILHSAEKISGKVDFRRQFQLGDVPDECIIRVRAMMQFSIVVNGQTVEEDSQREERNWKSARKYNIAPMLQESDNVIIIRVSNPEGPPALLVEGPELELPTGEIKLSSDTDWEAAPDTNFNQWVGTVTTFEDAARLGEKKGPIQNSPRYRIYIVLFGVYLVFILLAIKPWHFRKPDTEIPQHIFSKSRLLSLLPFLAIIVVILVINIHNTALYSHERSGFDWKGHVDYIRYMASNWRTPIATEGWEMFQPPLYYFLSAIIYSLFGGAAAEPGSLKAVQIMGTLSGVANTCFAWFALRKLFRNNHLIQLLGFSVVAFLPMCFYMNPLISNEIFSGFIISLAIYMLIRYGFEKQIKIHHAVIMGIAVRHYWK